MSDMHSDAEQWPIAVEQEKAEKLMRYERERSRRAKGWDGVIASTFSGLSSLLNAITAAAPPYLDPPFDGGPMGPLTAKEKREQAQRKDDGPKHHRVTQFTEALHRKDARIRELRAEIDEWVRLAKETSRESYLRIQKNLHLEKQLAEYGEMIRGSAPWMRSVAFDVSPEELDGWNHWRTEPVGAGDVEVRRWGAIIVPAGGEMTQGVRHEIRLLRSSIKFELRNLACDRIIASGDLPALNRGPVSFLPRHSAFRVGLSHGHRAPLQQPYKIVVWASGRTLYDPHALDLTLRRD